MLLNLIIQVNLIDLFCHSSSTHLLYFFSVKSPCFIALLILHNPAPLSFWRYHHVFLILIYTLFLNFVNSFSFQEKILWFIVTFYKFLFVFKWLILNFLVRTCWIPLFLNLDSKILAVLMILFKILSILTIILIIIGSYLLVIIFNANIVRWHNCILVFNQVFTWGLPRLKLNFILLRILNHRLRTIFIHSLLFNWLFYWIWIWGIQRIQTSRWLIWF